MASQPRFRRSVSSRATQFARQARRTWFLNDWERWTPRVFECYFTRTPVGIRVRKQEQAGVLAALDPFLKPSHRAADVGAGTGHYTLMLARRCTSVIATDPSPSMRRYLRHRLEAEGVSNVRLMAGRVPEWPAVGIEVDVVVCVGVLQYVPDLHAAIASLARIVRPGGRVIFTVTPATRDARGYARQERFGRRQIWLRTDPEIHDAADGAGLTVASTVTLTGVTRLATTVKEC